MSNTLNVIVGNEEAKAQDFVLRTQEVAKDDGFKNVSKIWYNKTISYDDACEQISNARKNREDLMVKVSNIEPTVNAKGQFVVKIGDGRELNFNDHAIKQFTAKMGSVWTAVDFLLNNPVKQNGTEKFTRDNEDSKTLVSWFKNCIRRLDKSSEFLFRIYDTNSCRAVLTDRYSIVDNLWYMEILKAVIPGGRCSHWHETNGDSIFGNILIPDTIRQESDSDYGGMISVRGCEIGKYAIKQMPSIFRAICMNGCLWGNIKGVAYKKRHIGINLDDLSEAIKENIMQQIPLMNNAVDTQLITKTWVNEAKFPWMLAQAAYDKNIALNVKEMEAVISEYNTHVKETDMKNTCFGFIDALTRASQTFNSERGEVIDMFAGSILKKDIWDTFNRRAKALSRADVENAFKIITVA